MSLSLDDLSQSTLDCLADLIEQRLENPDESLVPATWQDAVARQNAAADLHEVLCESGLIWIAAAPAPASSASLSLH
jgi:hypothetical protein